jgi:hypothetical protein
MGVKDVKEISGQVIDMWPFLDRTGGDQKPTLGSRNVSR